MNDPAPITTDPYDTLATLPDIKMVFEIGCDWMHETTPILRRIYPDATLHCFDPLLDNLARVRETKAEARLNAKFHDFALGNGIGWMDLWIASNGGLSSSLKHPVAIGLNADNIVNWREQPAEVFCTTLDCFCSGHGVRNIDLIHMDVQSGEDLVIKGGTEMLKRTRYIFTEHNTDSLYHDEPTFHGILALLPGWTAMHVWPYDALFRNDNLCQ